MKSITEFKWFHENRHSACLEHGLVPKYSDWAPMVANSLYSYSIFPMSVISNLGLSSLFMHYNSHQPWPLFMRLGLMGIVVHKYLENSRLVMGTWKPFGMPMKAYLQFEFREETRLSETWHAPVNTFQIFCVQHLTTAQDPGSYHK